MSKLTSYAVQKWLFSFVSFTRKIHSNDYNAANRRQRCPQPQVLRHPNYVARKGISTIVTVFKGSDQREVRGVGKAANEKYMPWSVVDDVSFIVDLATILKKTYLCFYSCQICTFQDGGKIFPVFAGLWYPANNICIS